MRFVGLILESETSVLVEVIQVISRTQETAVTKLSKYANEITKERKVPHTYCLVNSDGIKPARILAGLMDGKFVNVIYQMKQII